MTDDEERWLEIAGLILDGQPVAWEKVTGGRPAEDGSADALRVIADVADLHRAPTGERMHRWGTLAIQEQIGHGTFGDVYRARDAALDRDVALKLVDHTSSANAPGEGRLLARVRHSNVVTVHGAAIHDGRYGIWMEFIRGRTLAAVVREHGPLAVEDVAAIGVDVCRALTAVHESGLLHGDIKPQNVMREEGGRIVVMDFGTGRVVTDGSAGDRLAGTPLYLAPEVLSGAAPDVRADVYGAGVLLYYLLTGAHPVEGSTLDEMRAAHASGARTPVRSRRPELPRRLAATIERAVAVEPSDRFERAADLEDALRTSFTRQSRAFSKRLVVLIGVVVVIPALMLSRRLLSTTRADAITANVMTVASVDAMRLYNQSYELGSTNDWKPALALVKRAVATSDTSALAHTWQAWCLQRTGAPLSEVIAESKRAVEMSSPSEWERLWIEATYDGFTNDTNREVAALTTLVKLRPDHFWAVNSLAVRLNALGRTKEAVPYYVQRAELRPLDGNLTIRAAQELMMDGETDRAVSYARRARMIVDRGIWFMGAPSAWTLPVEALWRRGDVRGAAAALDIAVAECVQLGGQVRNDLAGSLLRASLSLGRTHAATEVSDQHFYRAIAAFHGGHQQLSRHEMSPPSSPVSRHEVPFDSWPWVESRAFYLIAAGRLRDAQVELDRSPETVERGAVQVDRGVLAFARGDRALALAFLRDSRPLETRPQSIYRFEYLADIYVQQRDLKKAIDTLEDSLQHRSDPFQALWWMRNELRLAELYHATGRDAEALPLEAHLDQLLVAADSDFTLRVRLNALERKTRPARSGGLAQ
jgi:serine/threonine-protein kinase